MASESPNEINKSLVRDRGKAIIEQAKEKLGGSISASMNKDTRGEAGLYIKDLVDADQTELTSVERQLVLQYVRDSIFASADPDERLDQSINRKQLIDATPAISMNAVTRQATPPATLKQTLVRAAIVIALLAACFEIYSALGP